MGNRAVITIDPFKDDNIGIYVHWNGGRDSIQAFLTYCKLKKYRAPDADNYGFARLCQVISNFFGGSTSIGVDIVKRLDCDNGDNGTYLLKGWDIVARRHHTGHEDNHYNLLDFLIDLDKSQPQSEQLGEDYITEHYKNV